MDLNIDAYFIDETSYDHVWKITVNFHAGFSYASGYLFSDEAGIFDSVIYATELEAKQALDQYCARLEGRA